MALFGLLRNKRHERAGFELYASSVAAARDPYFFTTLAVPDTLDGRFDLVGLFAALLIHRLRGLPAPGPALAQAVFDAMFADMDQNLREIGVGDMVIAKRVKAMWEAFHGRALAYEAALAAGDSAALAESLARNVWRGAAPIGAANRLAGIALAQAATLHTQDAAALEGGTVHFLAPTSVPA
jgi:cytochrome b pre-mRNA-processing protein 3